MKALIRVLGALAALLCVVSCSRKADYAAVIPAESQWVLSVDVKSLAEKMDLKRSKSIGELLQMLDVSGSATLSTLVDDPKQSGIDFQSPAYVFMCGDRTFGLAAKMYKKKNFEKMLEELVGSTSREAVGSGVYCQIDRQSAVYYDDDKILTVLSDDRRDIKRKIELLLSLDESEQMARTDNFARLEAEKSDAAFLAGVGRIAADMSRMWGADELPAIDNPDGWDGMAALASLNFESDRVVLRSRILPATDEQRQAVAGMMPGDGNLDMNYAGLCQDDGLMWLAFTAQGSRLIDFMDALGMSDDDEYDETIGQIRNLLERIDGTVAMSGKMEINRRLSEYYRRPVETLIADIGPGFDLNELRGWFEKDRLSVAQGSKGIYYIQEMYQGDTISVVRMADDALDAAGGLRRQDSAPVAPAGKMAEFAQEITRSNVFFFFDINVLRQNLSEMKTYLSPYQRLDMESADPLLTLFDYAVLKMNTDAELELRLQSEQSGSQNKLGQIVDAFVLMRVSSAVRGAF